MKTSEDMECRTEEKLNKKKKTAVSIRKAEARDIPTVLDLLLQVLTVHADGRPDIFRHDVTKYNEEELKEIFRDPTRPVFVAEKEGTVSGYAFCMFQTPSNSVMYPIKTLYIDDICVDEKQRGYGIGTQLFEHVKKFAEDQGCYNITLNVWACNETAMKFYESLGMKRQREYKEYIL